MRRIAFLLISSSLISSCLVDESTKRYSYKNNSSDVSGYTHLTINDARVVGSKYVLKQKYSESDLAARVQKAVAYTSYERDYMGHYKIGKPYEIKGVTYQPQEYENYEEVGQASWYGDDFHGRATANGEVYNMRDKTAAHRTLPLPSIVRVTNLDNGKSTIVRVNDRGPFASNRVIDVSESVAEELDFKDKGVANVKIEFLKDESRNLLSRLNLKSCDQFQDC